jgi:hypothetical protein
LAGRPGGSGGQEHQGSGHHRGQRTHIISSQRTGKVQLSPHSENEAAQCAGRGVLQGTNTPVVHPVGVARVVRRRPGASGPAVLPS